MAQMRISKGIPRDTSKTIWRRRNWVIDSGSVFQFVEGFVEELNGIVDVGFGSVEHGGEAKDVAIEAALADEEAVVAGALHNLCGGFGRGLFGLAVFDEFEGLHEAHAADFADQRVFLLKLFQKH